MRCPACQHESPEQAKYCAECGTRLLGSQPGPASYTPDHLAQRILTSRSALEGERKQVTVLFADLKGSMELLADRDPEEARAILDPVLERMMEAVHHYEGTVNQVMGDGIMALFGAPLAHEDHALRACYAALRMQETVQRFAAEARGDDGAPIAIRVGMNSGEVVVRAIGSDLHMDYTAVGQTTHLAARMEQTAPPGAILITPQTLRLVDGYVEVQPRGPTPIKGLAEPLAVYEVVGAGPTRTRLQASAARGLTRFVGRSSELQVLQGALARAGAGQGQVLALVGDPGVGKSRLVHELARSEAARGWRVLAGSSVSYGRTAAYLPVVDVLRTYLAIDPHMDATGVRQAVADQLTALDPALRSSVPALLALLDVPAEDAGWRALDPARRRLLTLDACKRLLLRATQAQPLLLVFEDLHWIDTETQALLDSLVDSLPTARLALLVTYRPEYQHGWGSRPNYTELRLAPLHPDGTEALLEALVGGDAGLAPLKILLRERTAGNPFFLEESVRTLVETGCLVGERGAYRLVGSLESMRVPATVQAILAARIDRLAPDDKSLLQAAAVIGKDVPVTMLEAVADAPGAVVRDGLARLCAADFLDEAGSSPMMQYRFKHALTYEVAYQGLLVGRRTELHGRAAVALEAQYGDRTQHLGELEVLGLHFSLSAEKLRGAHYLLAAGDRARTIYANADAARHYQRAVDLYYASDATRAEVHLAREGLADVLALVGRREEAQTEYAVVLDAHAAHGDRPAQARLERKLGGLCWAAGDRDRALAHFDAGLALLEGGAAHIEQAQLYQELGRLAFRGGDCAQAIAWARRALALAEALAASATEDQEEVAAAMAHAYNTLGIALARGGDAEAAVAHIERSLAVAQQHELLQVVCRAYTNLSVVYSTLDPGQAITTCLAGLELAQKIGDLGLQPWLYANLASAYCTFTGKCEAEGIAAARTAIALDRQLGQVDHLAVPLVVLGQIYQCHGDPARALQYYDEALRIAEEMHEPQLLFPCYDGLATLYLETGDVARAEHYMLEAQEVCERAGLEPDSLLVLPFLG